MKDSKGSSILKRIEAAGRKVLPMHEFLAESDPTTLDAFDHFLTHSIYREDGLQEAHKEMVLACVCVVAGSSQPVVAHHCRKALAAGLARDDLVQALEIAAAVMATRTLASGINAVIAAEDS
jgi:alkylhydroperoxidase/carboxymuconolactone decarboxylase family protein YurZ